MPITLKPPKAGRSKFYRVRGTYLGVRVDRSTETGLEGAAKRFLRNLEAAIERGAFTDKPELTLAAAVTSYVQGGGEGRFLELILRGFPRNATLADIGQAAADRAARSIYPRATPATRNRQFYTPLLAVMKHAKHIANISRPKGAQGRQRRVWLRPEQFEALAAAAKDADGEFAALATLLCYTGLRLGEALRLRCEDINLSDSEAHCRQTKNGEPRRAYLPPRVVAELANHPRGLDRKERLFRWSKCGELYLLAERVYSLAGIDHGGAPFHILRHTYGAMMTRVGADIVAAGGWKSQTAARIYKHFEVNEEARKAAMMPGAARVKQ